MSQPKKRKRYIHVLVIFLSTINQNNSEINTVPVNKENINKTYFTLTNK